MMGTVKIGEAAVPMLCTASTNIYYKRIFGVDPLALQTGKELPIADGINFAQQLAFIMAQQAAKNSDRAELVKMSEDDYIDWLDQFDAVDLQMALEDVMRIYRKDLDATAKPKKG